jgi:UDP-3-O-[3-hydroxymyristoyl] glucosamine N-acyltransferase
MTLGQIAALLNLPAPLPQQARINITGVATLAQAEPGDISFLGSDARLREFLKTRASAVLVQRRVKLPAEPAVPVLLVDDADLAVATVLAPFAPPIPRPPAGIDPTARIGSNATLADGVAVGPNVQIGQGTTIGRGTVIHAGVVISDDVTIGEQCEFFPNVVIRERITIGHRVTIHAGSVLGSDGFGYRWDGNRHQKIPQIGTVILEDDVEIGSCVCIDRAKFASTRVGAGTKIDNLVQIAHNVQIGPHSIIVAQVGLAGSVELGRGVVLGGQTAVRDHVRMGDGAVAAACSGIIDDVEAGMTVSGMPAFPHRQSLREQAALRRLPDLVVQVRRLTDEVERLKAQIKSP